MQERDAQPATWPRSFPFSEGFEAVRDVLIAGKGILIIVGGRREETIRVLFELALFLERR